MNLEKRIIKLEDDISYLNHSITELDLNVRKIFMALKPLVEMEGNYIECLTKE